MPYFQTEGANIYYEKKGNWESGKYPVVLLHGNGESMEIFDKTIEPLLSRLPFIAIDTRGHGKSEITDANYDFSYKVFANDVSSLLKGVGINQFDIVGFSDGAIIALLLASNKETAMHVMRVVAVGANISPKGLKSFAVNAISNDKRTAEAKGDRLTSALCSLMLREPNITASELASIYARVTVVAGSSDMIKRAHTEQIANSIIHARLVIIDGADHMIPQKFPEKLREIMIDEFD